MIVIRLASPALDELVAHRIISELERAIDIKGHVTLCPSAGRTWKGVYRRLVECFHGRLDWSRVHLVQMDDYFGMTPDHPFSLAGQIRRELAEPLRIPVFNAFHDRAPVDNASADLLKAELGGPIDLVLHGIGRNGHLGFNEPGASPSSFARVVTLHPQTLADNFSVESDREAFGLGVTLGLSTLLAAKCSFVLAKGSSKAAAVHRLLSGPVGDDCPASWLVEAQRVSIFADPAAMHVHEARAQSASV